MTTRRSSRVDPFRDAQRRTSRRRQAFEQLVAEALEELPGKFKRRLENVAVLVEYRPSLEKLREMGMGEGETLLGLYEGIPLTQRGTDYQLVTPDRIVLYMEPIEAGARNREEMKQEIRKTVLHEVAHFFGIPDAELVD